MGKSMSWVEKIRRFFARPAPPPKPPPRVFSNLTWQERVKQVQLPPEERFPVYTLAGAGKPPPPKVRSDQTLVQAALRRSGLSHARVEDADFAIRTFREQIPARKSWASEEFADILNDAGQAMPRQEAWSLTIRVSNSLLATSRDLKRQQEAGIELVRFRFGKTAAGHCAFSRTMEGKRIPIGKAIPLPSESCEHPDQCGCRWQAWLELMDELGIDPT